MKVVLMNNHNKYGKKFAINERKGGYYNMVNNQRCKSFISTILVVLLLCQAIPAFSVGNYVGHWAEKSVKSLVDKEIINGDHNGDFKLDDYITRAEFLAIIVRAIGPENGSDENFSDIDAESWYAEYFAMAYKAGYLLADENGNANPDAYITRAEVCVIITRVLGIDFKSTEYPFIDKDNVPDWAIGPITTMWYFKLVKGYPDGSFKPENNLTRAEGFTIISTILESGIIDGFFMS